MTLIKTILHEAAAEFEQAGNHNSAMEARILLRNVLGYSLEKLILNLNQELNFVQVDKFKELVRRRCAFEPIAYIIGLKEFYGRVFEVSKDVLIPRSDTETIIEAVKQNFEETAEINILELGIGSGCIGITLLQEFSNCTLEAVDISEKALQMSKRNMALHQIESKRFNIYLSNWFKKIPVMQFDLIISNPPYIALDEANLMSQETLNFEPNLALFSSSPDGLEAYRIIANNAHKYIKNEGFIILEIGFNQLIYIEKIFSGHNFKVCKVLKDLQNYNRVIVIQK